MLSAKVRTALSLLPDERREGKDCFSFLFFSPFPFQSATLLAVASLSSECAQRRVFLNAGNRAQRYSASALSCKTMLPRQKEKENEEGKKNMSCHTLFHSPRNRWGT